MSTDIAQTIASSQLFSSLNETEHAYLTQHASLKTFEESETIVAEGEKVLLNPRATVPAAREETPTEDKNMDEISKFDSEKLKGSGSQKDAVYRERKAQKSGPQQRSSNSGSYARGNRDSQKTAGQRSGRAGRAGQRGGGR